MPITPYNGDFDAGLAGTDFETFDAQQESLITGDYPPVVPIEYTVEAAQVLPEYTVVGFNGAGEVVPAVLGTTQAVGVLMYPVDAPSGDESAVVWRQGVFNPNILLWDVSYTTDEEKRLAFEGAPTPTAIVVRGPRQLDLTTP